MKCACAIFSSVACPALKYFPTISHKWDDYREKEVINHEMYWFSLQILSGTFLTLRRIQRDVIKKSYVYWTVHHCDSWRNLMSPAILFHFLCAQHVSDINISIIRSLRLFCRITTLVVFFLVRLCWSFGVVGLEWYPCCRLQPATQIPLQPNQTETPTHIEPRTIDQCGNSTE